MTPQASFRRDFIAVLALACTPSVGQGIARFAYALLLPAMKTDLNLTYAQTGWLNTTNALGYLLGALAAGSFLSLLGARRAVLAGTFACLIGVAATALFSGMAPLNLMRALAGFGGGVAFVCGGVIAAQIAGRHPDRGALLLGIFYGGAGLGIMASGVIVPALIGPWGWRAAWLALAAVSIIFLLAAIVVPIPDAERAQRREKLDRPARMAWFLAAYFCFGVGYIAYMTFMIAWLAAIGSGLVMQSTFWVVIGAAVCASPWVWAGALKNLHDGKAFALLCGVTGFAALLPLASAATTVQLVSGVLFGVSFFAVVASTTAFARRNFEPGQWASAISLLTICFGVGQIAGPVLVGWLNDVTAGLSTGLYASGAMLFVGAAIALLQRDFHMPND